MDELRVMEAGIAATAETKWNVTGMLVAVKTIGERRAAVMVYPDTGIILALETRLQPSGDSLVDTQAVFENHAHKVIGQERSLTLAMGTAETWLEEWAARTEDEMEWPCECGEIEARPRE